MYKYFEDYSNRLCTFNFENWPYRGAQLKPSKLASIGYECKDDRSYCNSCQCKYVVPDSSIPNDVVLNKPITLKKRIAQNFQFNLKYRKISYMCMDQYIIINAWSLKTQQSNYNKLTQKKSLKIFIILVQDQIKVLAIFGWLQIDQIFVCKFCGRKCEIESEEEFDVFGEHRYFCKWANKGKNFKYGYLTLLQKLKDQSGEGPKTSEQDTMKVQIMSTLEDSIKASQSKQQEEHKVKESIKNFREILNKRKRFSIQDFEKDWEILRLKKKKINIQSDLTAQQNQENQQPHTVVENENIQQKFDENNQSNQITQEYELVLRVIPRIDFGKILLQKQLEVNSKIIEIEEKLTNQKKKKKQIKQNPVASASIAQVHKAKLKNGDLVAVKIQKRNIRKQFASDLLVQFCNTLSIFQYYNFNQHFKKIQIKKQTSKQNYKMLKQGKRHYKQLVEKMSISLNIILNQIKEEYQILNGLMVLKSYTLMKLKNLVLVQSKSLNLLQEQIFISGFVHCDPHPGNILVHPKPGDNKKQEVVLLDFGLCLKLKKQFRLDYSKFWKSIFLQDFFKEIVLSWEQQMKKCLLQCNQ